MEDDRMPSSTQQRHQQQQSPELPKGVGITAVFVAIARAEAQKLKDPPFVDPYASFLARPLYDEKKGCYPLVESMREEMETPLGLISTTAIRTMWFDYQLRLAVDLGIRQIVNIGAGMDTRAYRFNFAEGTRFYELDFAPVLEYKNSILTGCGAQPKCSRHCLTADITKKGWTDLLTKNGFDPQEKTLWILEGLTMYLDEKENKELLSDALAVSGPGSRVAVLTTSAERLTKVTQLSTFLRLLKEENIQFKYGTADPRSLLSGCGWTVDEAITYESLCKKYNRPDLYEPMPYDMTFSSACKA